MKHAAQTALTLLAAAAMLAGCASARKALTPSASKTIEVAPPEPGAPKPTAGMDWTYAPVGTNAALTYGAAGGQPKLLLACAQKSGSVTVGEPGAAAAVNRITLISGSAKATVLAGAQPSPSDPSQMVLSAKFSTLDPIMQAFAHRRWIALPLEGDKVDNLVAHPEGAVAVREFFDFCG
ncbi:MAG: hypothetical protein JSR45_01065 [Proteobacteria bacterium]|nr:hypothetical protein [Pseudomonadota bacterium]